MVPLIAKVLPVPTKFNVAIGPEVIVVPAELIPKLKPPVAVTIPDALMLVALAAPKEGVTRVGDVANTSAPLPVSSVTADAKFDEDGVARNVDTFAPNPVTSESAKLPSKEVAVTTPTALTPPAKT